MFLQFAAMQGWQTILRKHRADLFIFLRGDIVYVTLRDVCKCFSSEIRRLGPRLQPMQLSC